MTPGVVSRRVYIDWLRGLAVVIMIEAHTIDAWTRLDVRQSSTFHGLQFLAGWAAPLFLFLAGVSVALSGAAQLDRLRRTGAVSRSLDTLRAVGWSLQKRGWQIFGLALLFRAQSYLLVPGARWSLMLKPDILNVLGLGMVLSAFCWSRAESRVPRTAWLLAPAALILAIASLAPGWAWPAALPPRIEAYLRINGAGTFSLFPWAGMVCVGAFVGQTIAEPRPVTDERRFHLRLAAAGALLAVAAYAGSFASSPFPHSSFWTTSISWFVLRVGVILVLLALSWGWMARPTAGRWSPMVVFGRTSLFVYWVHVEIVYGLFTLPLKQALPIPWVLVAYLAFTAVMLGAAVLWLRRPRTPWIPARLKA